MRRTLLAPALAVALLGLSALRAEDKAEPFLDSDLSGWEGLIKEHWKYQDGVLTGTVEKGLKFNTFLCSKKKYKDFEMKFKVRPIPLVPYARLEAGDARGDEVDDGADLALLQLATRLELHEHGGAARPTVAHERGRGRRGEVHARGFHGLQAGDRAHQFDFERVLVARGLHELTHAEAGVLADQLEAAVVARGQALRGELQARVVDAILRDHDGAGGGVDLVLDVGRFEGLRHGGGIGRREARIQQAPVRALRPQRHGDADRDGGGDAEEHEQGSQSGAEARELRRGGKCGGGRGGHGGCGVRSAWGTAVRSACS